MRKTIIFIAVLATTIMNGVAQGSVQAAGSVTVRELNIEIRGGELAVSFGLEVGREAVGRNTTAQVMPVIVTGEDEIRLPGIVIESRRTPLLLKRRWGRPGMPEGTVFTTNGTKVAYSAGVPLGSVRMGSDLKLEVSIDGCSVLTTGDAIMLAEDFQDERRVTIPAVYHTVPHSEGDMLSQKYTFVAPLSEFEEQSTADRNDFVTESRGTSLTVYFPPGGIAIDPGFRDNAAALAYLTDAVASLREAEAAGNSRLSHIIVAGYSSPEGDLAMNRYISYKRATALREHLTMQTGIEPEKIDIYNGGIDWAGLRFQVERSDMPEKEELIALIGNTLDITEEKEEAMYAKLRSLNGGQTYRRLLTSIFPELRVATYLRIYYENISPE